jgi:signal transduction histidine kinase
MNPIPLPDGSLYELALKADSAPAVMQISPPTLKAISDSLMNLLIDQRIPAIVWAKLPRGDLWWIQLDRYAALERLPKALYLFRMQREETEDVGESSAGDATNPVSIDPASHSPTSDAVSDFHRDSSIPPSQPILDSQPTQTSAFSVLLPLESLLRREYFLIVWASQFQGAFFAHRPRSVQSTKTADFPIASLDVVSSYGQASQLLETPPDRKQLLLTICALDTNTIRRSLHGLEKILTSSQLQLAKGSIHLVPGENASLGSQLVHHWQQWQANLHPTSLNLPLVEQLLYKHLQSQEEATQRHSIYRKQAEQAEMLRLQNEELLNTLRLKDDFLNNVGQELRTPLTTIKTALTLLSSPNIKPPQRQRYMDLIAKECDRQSSLITSLLDLVHLEDQAADPATLPPLRISEVVPAVVSTYQPVAEEKGVQVAYTIPDDLPPVACMSNWLKQIIINLLHNGIKFTAKGGQVWVRAKQQGDYVQLQVKDTGIGIAPNEIPKIFDRFYRVRQSADDSSGAGLGLTIVQQLLLHCGGSISVKSKLGEGSTFNVLLPIYRNPTDLLP